MVVGIRALAEDENYVVGSDVRSSYDWDFEADTTTFGTDNEICLGGTCAIDTSYSDFDGFDEAFEEAVSRLSNEFGYCGKKVLIAGDFVATGDDENEIIIANAKVIRFL